MVYSHALVLDALIVFVISLAHCGHGRAAIWRLDQSEGDFQ